ncbi:uncharacterized protein [Drosophila tropicalis]|uniref:uncharacterized protein n=1 Tax=Drosophila tropicalis TaxID=46794 RepID=UPI0035ABF0C4
MESEIFGENETEETASRKLYEASESLCQIPYPLPPHADSSLCRDQFLKGIFKDYDQFGNEEKTRMGPDLKEKKESTAGTAEGLAIQRMIERKTRKTILTLDVTGENIQTKAEKEQAIFLNYRRQFQKDAVEFLIVRLLRQLELFENVWPGDINEIPHKLFWWSVEHFLQRLSINQLYLDVITRERGSDDLDCMKYRTDLSEISSILHALRDDFCGDRDLCRGAITMIHAASYHINSNWINEIQEIHLEHDDLVRKIFAFRANTIIHGHTQARQSALLLEGETQDALTPIELRYRITWVRTGVEQYMLRIQQKLDNLERELSKTTKLMSDDALVFHYTESLYGLQIHKYRTDVARWQERYDNDFENADLQCTQTRLALDKLRDEFIFYSDQLAMMKRRIAEVVELMKKEEEHRIQQELDRERQEMEKNKPLEDKQKKKAQKENKKNSKSKKSKAKF